MKFSVRIFLAGISIGAICILVSYLTMEKDRYYPALVVLAPVSILWGIAALIFPGAEPGPDTVKDKQIVYSFKNAKPLNKVMWIVFAAAGLAIGLWVNLKIEGLA